MLQHLYLIKEHISCIKAFLDLLVVVLGHKLGELTLCLLNQLNHH